MQERPLRTYDDDELREIARRNRKQRNRKQYGGRGDEQSQGEKDFNALRLVLEARREEIAGKRKRQLSDLAVDQVPTDIPEVARGEYERASGVAAIQQCNSNLAEIDAALHRFAKGTYGKCEGRHENCEGEIPPKRLQAIPWTRYCHTCAATIEDSWKALQDRPGRLVPAHSV